MSKRFLISKECMNVYDKTISIFGDELNHIKALRYKKKDIIYINEYVVEIEKILKDSLIGTIIGIYNKKGEPKIDINLYIGYLKSDKIDYVVQKAVELGVSTITPIMTKNTVVKLNENDRTKKKERFQKIAIASIEQCGRTDNVIIKDIKDIKEIIYDIKENDLIIICHEKEKFNIRTMLDEFRYKDINKIAIIIGPEGGLDNQEVEIISKNSNVKIVNLGERILRAETAVNYILSVLDYKFNY